MAGVISECNGDPFPVTKFQILYEYYETARFKDFDMVLTQTLYLKIIIIIIIIYILLIFINYKMYVLPFVYNYHDFN